MNAQMTMNPVIEDEIDLLVAGELGEERRALLLNRLGEEEDGWEICAQRFLEAQAWREAMAGDPSALVEKKSRRRIWPAPLAAVAAAVLGFAGALFFVDPGQPVAEVPDEAPVMAESAVRLVPYPVYERRGFVPISDERGNLCYQLRGDVPPAVLEALMQAGHQVKHVERFVDLPREGGGDPLRLPMTETLVFLNYEL